MMRTALVLQLAAAGLAAAPAPAAEPAGETRLVIIGGGERPPEALGRFVSWAGGASARVLVLPWASGEPRESCEAILVELAPHAPGAASCGPHATLDAKGRAAPLDAARKTAALAALARATGVFFTGGDQARIMDVLADRGAAGRDEGALHGGSGVRRDERGRRRDVSPHDHRRRGLHRDRR